MGIGRTGGCRPKNPSLPATIDRDAIRPVVTNVDSPDVNDEEEEEEVEVVSQTTSVDRWIGGRQDGRTNIILR